MGAQPSFARCVEIEPPQADDEGPVYANSIRLEENGGEYITTLRSMPDAKTTTQVLDGAAIKHNTRDCMGEREALADGKFGKYKWISYITFKEMCINFASGLQKLGIKKGDTVGIYSHNCIWWQVAQFGSQYIGAIPVPVYDSLGKGAALYIARHAEIKVLVANPLKYDDALNVAQELNIEHLIMINNQSQEGVKTTYDITELGRQNISEFVKYDAKPEDTAMIMYTSGSTGEPKGCILYHRSIVGGGTGLASVGASTTTKDTFYSFLPLAHIYELGCEIVWIAQGVRIGYSSGSTLRIMEDVNELRPTIMCVVPRVLNRVAGAMQKKINALSGIKKWLVTSALSMKEAAIRSRKPSSFILDMLVFEQFRKALGGRIRLFICGGAPILPEIYEMMKATITPNIIQGYGLTEIAAAGCVQECGTLNPLPVGPISIAADLKLRRVEGFNYDPRASPPSGEILIRGPALFAGYHKNKALTDEVYKDGWFATGDIGTINPDGSIQIIDRAKQLVKLSQGEYLSITTLSDVYGKADGVEAIYLYADSHHNKPIAVVVPTRELLEKWAAAGISEPTESSAAKEEVIKNLDECATKSALRGFERIAAVILEKEPFSIENGLLTPSQKPQFQAMRSKYEARLIELYDQHPELRG